jgi:hypothetical protein
MTMMMDDMNSSIENWIQFVEANNFERLIRQPSADSWSLGQVVVHLIEQTEYFVKQMTICNCSNENDLESMTPAGITMFKQHAFPDMIINGPASNALTPQPHSKEELLTSLNLIKTEMDRMGMTISASHFKGKTKHPGLGYFSAAEWWQFTDMHFRHHIRQRERIVKYLQSIS